MSAAAHTAREFCVAILCLLASSSTATAQQLDNQSAEYHEQVWFVPRLLGALSVEGGLVQPLTLGTASGYPTTWFAGVGWKHYLEGHGRAQLRLMLQYEHGGVLNPKLEGTANRAGASAAFTVRGIAKQWFFGQLTASLDGSVLTLRPPTNPLDQERADVSTGFELGGGLETTFGSMFVLDPYLMAETGASATVAYIDLGGVQTFELWARWIVRFDWAFRRFDD